MTLTLEEAAHSEPTSEVAPDHDGHHVESEPLDYKLPESATPIDYILHPWKMGGSFFTKLVRYYGWRFVIMMSVMYLLVKGILASTVGLVNLSYCKKTLKVDGPACQTMGVIAATPWAMKGTIGVISDAYPLFGYHKNSYILIAGVLGTTAFLFLAISPMHSVTGAALLFMLGNLEIAVADLLCEGKYAGLMKSNPKSGSSMVSFVWGCCMVGGIIASSFVGPVADQFDPRILFWACVPLAASIMIPTALGYLSDPVSFHPPWMQLEEAHLDNEQVADEDKRGIQWKMMKDNWKLVTLCTLMALFALGNAIVDYLFFDNHLLQLTFCITGSLIVSVLSFMWLPRQLACCNFYMFISGVLYVNLSGAQDFWFTADETCVPGGPAFDYTYYNTYTSIVGSVTGWVGIIFFETFFSGWSFRRVFMITTLLQVVAACFDLVIINRLNIKIGIPDKAFYMFGDAVIGPAIGSIAFMPAIVLTSKLVQKGLESTTYALLAGFTNFGSTVSSQIGIFVTSAAGISTTEPCNFDRLTLLVFMCHCALPLLSLPLVYLLIPNKLMTEPLEDDTPAETVTSSLEFVAPRPHTA